MRAPRNFVILLAALVANSVWAQHPEDHSWFPGKTWLPPTGGDITIPDGTVVMPGQKLTKIWLIINDGNRVWLKRRMKCTLATKGLVVPDYVAMPDAWFKKDLRVTTSDGKQTKVSGGCLITMDFTAPMEEGDYSATFKQADENGKLIFPKKDGITIVITVKKKSQQAAP